jgi:septal ring factor EnvC (AmiA/AmiB activator)
MPEAAALDRDSATGANSPIVQAAERLVSRIEALVNQVAELKADNAALRREVREAVALIDRAGDAAAQPRAVRRAAAPVARHAKGRRRGKGPKGRATPASVTPDIVLATIGKLGSASASEIARELSGLGDPVSGRAVRWLAERAGAATVVGEDGQLRYRLPAASPRPG